MPKRVRSPLKHQNIADRRKSLLNGDAYFPVIDMAGVVVIFAESGNTNRHDEFRHGGLYFRSQHSAKLLAMAAPKR